MEIPQEIQEILRCVECNELLSCGPVYLVHETSAAICGRCSPQSEEEEEETPRLLSCGPVFLVHETSAAICGRCSPQSIEKTPRSRNLQYEALAKQFSYPCSFAANGCPEKMEFSEQEPNTHERECDFRTFVCPVVEKGSCDWIGSRRTLLEHCRDAHPTHLFKNADELPQPDLTHSHLINYIITAFDLIFLLHLKICVSSGKLYQSVRVFNPTILLENFSYSFKIEGNNSKTERNGPILPKGVLALQEHSSNSIKIKSLLDCNYDDSKFTLTIRSLLSTCLNCLNEFRNVADSNICPECQGNLLKCEFSANGCLFVDVNKDKCLKHRLFCKYQKECCLCRVNFVSGSFIEHFSSSTSCYPNSIKSNINSVNRLTNTKTNNTNFIIFSSNNIGTIICDYQLSNSNFYLHLYSSLPFYELKNLKCSIELRDPQTKDSELLTPQIRNNNVYEWIIDEEMDNFPSWENVGIDIKINIT